MSLDTLRYTPAPGHFDEVTGLDGQARPVWQGVARALEGVRGTWAICVVHDDFPGQIVAARNNAPLLLGLGEGGPNEQGEGENFVASDVAAMLSHTRRVVDLEDGDTALVTRRGIEVFDAEGRAVERPERWIDWSPVAAEKQGYRHFMLKEIHEQPRVISDTLAGRIQVGEADVNLDGLELDVGSLRKITIVACGTSWHAGLAGKYMIERLARIPVEVEYASEFRYRNPIINETDIVIALSQSGETADTLAAIELAKEKGALVYGVVNVVGSSISRLTNAGSYIHAGPEIGVASTKAFTGQVTLLTMMALQLAHSRGTISESYFQRLLAELEQIPHKVARVLESESQIQYIASEIQDSHNALYLGRGFNFPVALEGALKLKEISYIHAEGYPAAEMKHGPIALIDENMPVIVTATNRNAYDKIVSNIQEVKARKGKVIAIVSEGEKAISEMADYTIHIPETEDPLAPLLSVIPLQLLSYYIAVGRGCNVDQPRNLAKSVTVE